MAHKVPEYLLYRKCLPTPALDPYYDLHNFYSFQKIISYLPKYTFVLQLFQFTIHSQYLKDEENQIRSQLN